MYCIECGKQIPDNSKFCLNCGAPQPAYISKDPVPDPEPAPEAQVQAEPLQEAKAEAVQEVKVAQEAESAQELKAVQEPAARQEPTPDKADKAEKGQMPDWDSDQTEGTAAEPTNEVISQWTDQMPPPIPEKTPEPIREPGSEAKPEPLPYIPPEPERVYPESPGGFPEEKRRKIPVPILAGAGLLATLVIIASVLIITGIFPGRETVYYVTKETTYDASDNLKETREISYDEDHHQKEAIIYDASGNVEEKTTYSYDAAGRMQGYAYFDGNGKVTSESSLRYDGKDRQVASEYVSYHDDGSTYRCTSETSYNDSDHTYVEKSYSYTESNVRNMDYEVHAQLDAEGRVVSSRRTNYDNGYTTKSHADYERDDKGNLLKYTSYDDTNHHEECYSEYTYDSRGKCTGYKFYWYPRDYDWDTYGRETITYKGSSPVLSNESEYDEHGNITKDIDYDNETGELESYTVYEYGSYKAKKKDKK